MVCSHFLSSQGRLAVRWPRAMFAHSSVDFPAHVTSVVEYCMVPSEEFDLTSTNACQSNMFLISEGNLGGMQLMLTNS